MPTRIRGLLALAAVMGLAGPAEADAAPLRTKAIRGPVRVDGVSQSPLLVERRTAASWLAIALEITRRWSRIYTLGCFSLYDDRPRPRGDDVNCGLLDRFRCNKPAYVAYKRG
jgi:hypothetical protein